MILYTVKVDGKSFITSKRYLHHLTNDISKCLKWKHINTAQKVLEELKQNLYNPDYYDEDLGELKDRELSIAYIYIDEISPADFVQRKMKSKQKKETKNILIL